MTTDTAGEPGAAPNPGASRRERLRRELTEEIKACANRHLEASGPEGVTLRGIARDLGVSPAALYGYFDSLDALFTAVIVDHYDDLADAVAGAVAAAADEPLGPRMLAAIRAYRAWAVEHPAAFRLLFFAPLTGYEAPRDGPTLTAALRVFVPMLAILVEGWQQGLVPDPAPGPFVDPHEFQASFGLAISSDQLRVAVGCWAMFHGFVALEIGGHVNQNWVDPAELFEAAIRTQTAEMGLPGV